MAVLSSLLLGAASLAISGCAAPGCEGAHDYKDKAPQYASVIRSGHGHSEFIVNNPGRATLFDVCENHILWTSSLNVGDKVVISSERDRVLVNGQEVATPGINTKHEYRVYWLDEYSRDLAHDTH
jgi:hypothetical protein